MNEKQQRALIKAYLSLERHFPHSVIIVCEKEVSGSIQQPDPVLCWSGGYIACKHLIQDAQSKIDRRKLTRSVPNIGKEIIDSLTRKKK